LKDVLKDSGGFQKHLYNIRSWIWEAGTGWFGNAAPDWTLEFIDGWRCIYLLRPEECDFSIKGKNWIASDVHVDPSIFGIVTSYERNFHQIGEHLWYPIAVISRLLSLFVQRRCPWTNVT
jgi:hypothetical protein